MKTKLYTAIAILSMAFGMTACSSSDEVSNDNNGQEDEASLNYLKVNVREMNTAGSAGAKAITRADDTSDDYADGSQAEGFVGTVRFYFFTSDGNAYPLSNSSPVGVNYITHDFSSESQTDPNTPTVENRTAAVLVLSAQDATLTPTQVVAIANTDALSSGVLDNTSKSLTELQDLSQTTTNRLTNNTHFLMSSSVYLDNQTTASGSIKIAENDISSHLHNTRDAANNDAVDIYVERLAAKVNVNGNVPTTVTDPTPGTGGNYGTWGLVQDGTNTYPAFLVDTITIYSTTAGGARTPQENVPIRALVKGWGLADATDKGKVFKDISTYNTWWNQLGPLNSGSTNTDPRWYSTEYKRSFWEVTSDYNRQSPKWNELTTSFGNDAYTMPNTPDNATSWNTVNRRPNVTVPTGSTLATTKDLTKVVVGATLQYYNSTTSSWENANLYRFNGRFYLDETSVKNEVLLLYGSQYFTDASHTTQITTDDIDFENPTSTGQVSDYQQKIKLKSGNTYYDASGNTVSGGTQLGSNGTYITHFNNGSSYYYTTIQHIWATNDHSDADNYLGYFGVVRNHYYKITINSLSGPGTPVPNPDEPIIPVTPNESISYLSAQINVLQWRVVNQTVDINGNGTTSSAKKH